MTLYVITVPPQASRESVSKAPGAPAAPITPAPERICHQPRYLSPCKATHGKRKTDNNAAHAIAALSPNRRPLWLASAAKRRAAKGTRNQRVVPLRPAIAVSSNALGTI